MGIKPDSPGRRLQEERLRFFAEIGAGFISRDELGAAVPPDPDAASLEIIAAEVLVCRKCGLAGGRTRAVPGEGDPRAALMFVGEGPGHDEDVQGRPFVGRAGQLLTRIIAAMGFERNQVYITNIVKCRPPDNRVPRREEVEACSPYLRAQIRAIGPKVIVTLGKSSADFFFPDAATPMTRLRGEFREWSGVAVMPTFHPSYLVRNEGNLGLKKMVWEDMQKVMARLAGK